MSGNRDIFQYACEHCGHVNTPAKGKALTLAMTCPKCEHYFCVHSNVVYKFLKPYTPLIPLGAKGKINGEMYEVFGFAVKREKRYQYSWHEYTLFNPQQGVAYLTQYDGNWNYLKPYSKHPWMVGQTENPTIDKGKFQLYAKYRSEVLYASGEFFSDIIEVTKSSQHYEHIHPPYVLNFEESNERLGAFLGEYISPDKVTIGFNLKRDALPKKKGMGYTEPLLFSFKEATLIQVSLASLLLASALIFIFTDMGLNQKVLSASFDSKDLKTQKMFTTASFNLEGDMKNLMVQIHAPLSNDWFAGEYSLINESTDQEFVFTKELEHYSGTEGGENWTEGSNESEAFLSKIPGGKYHINIYPEFSLSNHEFSIEVYRDVPFYSNFIITLILLALFPTGFYIYRHVKEMNRWSESDYTPYN